MSLRNSKPITFRAKGLSDARDGTNAFPGAMSMLQNLIPDPGTEGVMVPRPAAIALVGGGPTPALWGAFNWGAADWGGFGTVSGAGQINALLGVGNIYYGLIASTSGTYSGYDVPFAYDLLTQAFLPITIPGGAASLPVTPATSGDWTPPTVAVIGGRVVFTHPGFPGGSGPYFGWLDISGFSSATIVGDTHSTSSTIVTPTDVLSDGWEVGMTIADSNSDIPANTTITGISVATLDLNTTATTNSTTALSAIANVTGLTEGCAVSGSGIPLGTYLISVNAGAGTAVMSAAATSGASGVALNFSGATTVTMSAAATGSHNGTTFTVAGGTAADPLWGSGNTNENALSAVPVWVSNYNSRAYYGVPGAGTVFSDPGNATNIAQPTQALTAQNGLDMTAAGGLPVTQTAGGILAALVIFQGATEMQMVVGDVLTSNLSLNSLGVGVGCIAPNTICQTPLGLTFVAPDGLRYVNFIGEVSNPIGFAGSGVLDPFLNAIFPSRMAAAYNQDVFRVTVQNGEAAGQPLQDYWYHISRKSWSGPHTFTYALAQPYQGTPNHGFVLVGSNINATLFSSAATPAPDAEYTELGAPMNCVWTTALWPDNAAMAETRINAGMLGANLPSTASLLVTATDETSAQIAEVTITGPQSAATIWDEFTWGAAPWSGQVGYFIEYDLPWPIPLVFKQATFSVIATAVAGLAIGNLYFAYQPLGYRTQRWPFIASAPG